MPRSTPAANNKAITLMTSLVAICGNGFSAEKKQQHAFKEKLQKMSSTENVSVKQNLPCFSRSVIYYYY